MSQTDDPFYSPGGHRPASRVPRLCERVWALRRDHVTWSAALRCHGESWGWEVQILRDGELVIGRRFDLRQMAEQWAGEERKAFALGGGDDRFATASGMGGSDR